MEELLHIDCRKEENEEKLQEYLLSMPQVKKAFEKEFRKYEIFEIPLDILERYLHQLSIRKGYQVINIQPFYGNNHDEFIFYTSSAKRTKDNMWIGSSYGLDLYETIAKLIVLINKDIKYPRKEGLNYE